MANKKDLVEITCYGTTKIFERKKAIKEFREAMFACEGHEQARYAYIYECLLYGDKVIDDSNV